MKFSQQLNASAPDTHRITQKNKEKAVKPKRKSQRNIGKAHVREK